jgi:hypothetical protein
VSNEEPSLTLPSLRLLLLRGNWRARDIQHQGQRCGRATVLGVEGLLQQIGLRLSEGIPQSILGLHQERVLAEEAFRQRPSCEGCTVVASWSMAIKDTIQSDMTIVRKGVPGNEEIVLIGHSAVKPPPSRADARHATAPSSLYSIVREARYQL